jgi:hypothetical protein
MKEEYSSKGFPKEMKKRTDETANGCPKCERRSGSAARKYGSVCACEELTYLLQNV